MPTDVVDEGDGQSRLPRPRRAADTQQRAAGSAGQLQRPGRNGLEIGEQRRQPPLSNESTVMSGGAPTRTGGPQ